MTWKPLTAPHGWLHIRHAGNVYLTVVYMWNNNHKPVSWYLISQRSTCPNPLLFVTFSLQLDSDGNGSDQDISEYSYGLFAYLKCRPVLKPFPICLASVGSRSVGFLPSPTVRLDFRSQFVSRRGESRLHLYSTLWNLFRFKGVV